MRSMPIPSLSHQTASLLRLPVAHSSPANIADSLEPRHFGMWSRFDNSLNHQNYEAYLRANSRMVSYSEVIQFDGLSASRPSGSESD